MSVATGSKSAEKKVKKQIDQEEEELLSKKTNEDNPSKSNNSITSSSSTKKAEESMQIDEDLSDTERNSESADLSEGANVGNTDDYYASGGSGSEKELQALGADIKTKQKSKTKGKSSDSKLRKGQGQRLITDFVRPKNKEVKTRELDFGSGSDTDPVDSEDSDKEKPTKTSKKKKMGNNLNKTKNYETRSKKNTRGRSSDSDDDFTRPAMYKRWSDRDTEQYRSGYPGKKDDPKLIANQEFYFNQRTSYPDGDKIDNIHKTWWGDYSLLERHHGYIQWLFPIRESGMNWHAQELQLHEAKAIKSDKKAHARILKSYEMMLNFYGVDLVDSNTGELARADNWASQFLHLNRSTHNYLRITRILKSLGEFDYEHLKGPFVSFMITEALQKKSLPNVATSCMNYWVGTIKDDKQRQKCREMAIKMGYDERKF